jgi:glutamine synthetase
VGCRAIGGQPRRESSAGLTVADCLLDYLNRPRGVAALDKPKIAALNEIMGERFVRSYSAVKNKEYETFFHVISSWEREFLLLNV